MRTKKKPGTLNLMGKYRLTSDAMNIILEEKFRNQKQQKYFWRTIAYFSTPQNALRFVVQKEIRETWVEDLQTVIKNTEKIYKTIDGLDAGCLPEVARAKSDGFED